jgi:hypothetical protein
VQSPRTDAGAAGAARRFEFGRPGQRTAAEQVKTDQAAAPTSPGEEPAAAPPAPVAETPAKVLEAAKPADPLDALEEEMAKLLGRPPGQS